MTGSLRPPFISRSLPCSNRICIINSDTLQLCVRPHLSRNSHLAPVFCRYGRLSHMKLPSNAWACYATLTFSLFIRPFVSPSLLGKHIIYCSLPLDGKWISRRDSWRMLFKKRSRLQAISVQACSMLFCLPARTTILAAFLQGKSLFLLLYYAGRTQ